MSRRDSVKRAAALAIGVGLPATQEARGQEPKKVDPQPTKQSEDPQLERAIKNPAGFMFAEQVTFQTSTTEPHSFYLVITSARDAQGKSDAVEIRPGTMKIFRADASQDDFTKKGGVYWKCGKTEGKVQFKQPGALVLALREQDGTVRCYSLALDFRC